ncbi:uncharacterized protein PHACADRAFT_264095 [Phanerochaete carnosa HHB-10118-sp]|uniref:RanBD1 domain-containing protein n=1 Tax=Phanerochaete carnosa (strain HHB-10118-sp) TaxID=650164 RepID=K5VVT1_PHACS|nr:uncharacterized protein PHACADRAFT_264095 [Phanerochaete carnosa HHB-10118-sp]EKM50689.1 hypothetical protein PHACADRAFT_264095 [Phanerochaete carnosa HHB-10118-sp]
MAAQENTEEHVIQDMEASVQGTNTPPEDIGSTRQSRKREREVSLEPGTPQAASIDIEPSHYEAKDRRTPAKKNRLSTQLDATEEEDEAADAPTAIESEQGGGSPRHESKIRQISQGVEDLTWQNMPKQPSPGPEPEEPVAEETTEHEMAIEEMQYDKQETITVPPLLRGENPPMALDGDGDEEHAGEADPAEVPPEAQHDDHTLQENIVSAPPHSFSTPPDLAEPPEKAISRRASEESMDQEKGLKRKLGDRTVSDHKDLEEQLVEQDAKKASASKRPRDDPDKDANPREPKRPTPPPDEEKRKEAEATGVANANSSRTTSQERSKASTPTSTPPLSQEQPVQSSAAPKLSGFMAYASPSSPFATAKGPSMFSSKPSPWASASSSSSIAAKPILSPSPVLGSASSSTETSSSSLKEPGLKRTGFEAFASSSSPFASAAKRPKSPIPMAAFGNRNKSPMRNHSPARVSAFSAYATGGAHAFSTAAHRRSETSTPSFGDENLEAAPSALNPPNSLSGADNDSNEDSEGEKGVSFGERLRASKDDEDPDGEGRRLNLTEQEVQTGEEDEDTIYQVRGKLFALSDQNQWKERGTGQLKLNVRKDDGSGARLLMRKEAVYTVLLNATLFKGMKCFLAQDPRYIRFSVFEAGVTTHYNLRVSNAKIAMELLDEISLHIPS